MLYVILRLRLRQFLRLLRDIGLFRILVLAAIIVLVSLMVFSLLKQPGNTRVSLIVIALMLLSIHAARKDKHFLKVSVKNNYLVYFIEYFLLSLPVLIIWFVFFNITGILILIGICVVIPLVYFNLGQNISFSALKILLNPFSSNLNFRINFRIPFLNNTSFEWKSGIRRNALFLVPVYLFLLAFSFKPLVGPVGLLIISVLLSGFYLQGEPREFIEYYAGNPGEFLKKKIRVAIRSMMIILSPICIISVVFQPGTWYYIAGALILSLFIQVISIIFKYALFEENVSLNKNSMIVLLNIFFILVPLFWLVPVIMGIRYYYKAQQNLKKYFND